MKTLTPEGISVAGKLLVTLEEGPAGGAERKRLGMFKSVTDALNPAVINTTACMQTRATQGKGRSHLEIQSCLRIHHISLQFACNSLKEQSQSKQLPRTSGMMQHVSTMYMTQMYGAESISYKPPH